jgi:hypothetical protein
MPQRTLKIYIENQLYKEITVDTNETGGYSVSPVLEIIAADRQAGLLDSIPGYSPNHLSIKIELKNR